MGPSLTRPDASYITRGHVVCLEEKFRCSTMAYEMRSTCGSKCSRVCCQNSRKAKIHPLVWEKSQYYNRCSRRTKWHRSRLGQAALSGQLYIPSLQVENNIRSLIVAKLDQIVRGLSSLAAREGMVAVSCNSAGRLTSLPQNSIDYVFCDPPFGSNIYYSEVNLLWEAWLGRATDQSQEAVVHRKNDRGTKTIDDYARLMREAFVAIFRVLKPGRWATVEFNNSDGAVFEVIKKAIRNAGFEIANMLLLDKEQKTFKQVKGAEGVEDVVDKDVLFNLHKPAVVRAEPRREEHDLEQQVADAVREHLLTLPERIMVEPAKYSDEHRTTATINSMLMNALIPKGVSVDRLNLPFIERVCGRYFRKVGNRWYLRGEAVGSNGGDSLIEEEVVIRDEVTAIDWLRRRLQMRPMLIGELKPLWMRATGLLPAEVSRFLALEDLLADNFWRDGDTNRWREPTAEERERMNDDRALRVLHDAERFLVGTLNRETTDEERCKWIDVLFQACRVIKEKQAEALPALRGFDPDDAYRMIARLFQSVLKDHVSAEVYGRAEKQDRAASRQIAERAEEQGGTGKNGRKDDKQATLDFGGAA